MPSMETALVCTGEVSLSPGISAPGAVLQLAATNENHEQPLVATFGDEVAAQFFWVVSTDTVETYEHRETSRFVHIDGITGECFNQNYEAISPEAALQHALRPGNRLAGSPAAERIAEPPVTMEVASAARNGSTDSPRTIEPELHAFMRKMELAAGFEEATALADTRLQLSGFEHIRQGMAVTGGHWLRKMVSWSDPLVSKAQEGGHLQPAQEANFANFTRRISSP